MQKNKKKTVARAVGIALGAAAVFFIFSGLAAHAGPSIDFPTNFADFSSSNLKQVIENIVRIVLGFVGILFVVLLLYGGLVWMTSRGDDKKITQAKKIIASAVIGLLITLGSYAIAHFIIQQFGGAVGSGGPGGTSGGPNGGLPGGVALGAGIIESHYPGRNATGVARNANIIVTFKEALKPDTVCSYAAGRCAIGNAACANNAACGANGPCIGKVSSEVEIKDMQGHEPADANDTANDDVLEGVACQTLDDKTFKFDPPALLGYDQGDSLYQVYLKSGIKKANNATALPLGYSWRFTISNFVDTTAPKVLSVFPIFADHAAPNAIVQINFSEPIDPSTASGIFTQTSPTFTNIKLDTVPALPITAPLASPYIYGQYMMSNQYRTTEFLTNGQCAGAPTNSCGENIYCLPAGAHIYGVIAGAGNPLAIKDMAGNELDGTTDDPGADPNNVYPASDYVWYFDTDTNPDLTPPVMISREPARGSSGADVREPVRIKFSELLSPSSLNSTNVGFGRNPAWPPTLLMPDNLNYWVDATSTLDFTGDGSVDTTVLINHDQYDPLKPYHPGVTSDIRDAYQNCYFPTACDTNTPADGNPNDTDGNGVFNHLDCTTY